MSKRGLRKTKGAQRFCQVEDSRENLHSWNHYRNVDGRRFRQGLRPAARTSNAKGRRAGISRRDQTDSRSEVQFRSMGQRARCGCGEQQSKQKAAGFKIDADDNYADDNYIVSSPTKKV